MQDQQLQQIVDKTIMEADKDGDGKLNFDEFANMVQSTDIVKWVSPLFSSGSFPSHRRLANTYWSDWAMGKRDGRRI